MKIEFVTVITVLMGVPLLSANAVNAQSNQDLRGMSKFKLYAHKAFKSDVITMDGMSLVEPLNLNLIAQIGNARSQANGATGIHYMIPGHSSGR